MVGLVVTPTTLFVAMSSARLPERNRSRDKSSNQTATPAALSAARFVFCSIMTDPPPVGHKHCFGIRPAVG